MLHDPHDERLLEVHEVAYRLKSSQETVLRLIRKGKLAAIRPFGRSYRVDRADLDAYLEAHRVKVEELPRRESTVRPLPHAVNR